MSSFNFIAETYRFTEDDIELIDSNYHAKELYPVIYILFDDKKRIAYVGESTNIKSRLKSHLKNKEKNKLTHFYLISSEYFNKSAALDIESLLIQYLPPGANYRLLNGNLGIVNHQYYQQPKYQTLFKGIWSSLELDQKISKSLLDIENTDLFKFSPYKSLTISQFESIKLVLKSLLGKTDSVFIQGAAGTGKTIVGVTLVKLLTCYHLYEEDDYNWDDLELKSLIVELKSKYPNGLNVGFVVPMSSLRQTLKNVFASIYGLKKSMVIGPSEVDKKDYDILIVDEAHRLQRRVGITNYKSFDDFNRKHGLGKNDHQLDWINKCSKKKVLFYDTEQSIKPADVRHEDFAKLKKSKTSTEVLLQSQMRCIGGNGYIDFVSNLLNCTLKAPFLSSEYDIKIFSDMSEMVKALGKKEKEHGLCRMMSGYSWEWTSRHDDKPDYDAKIDGVELTWNRESKDWINSTTAMTEMGCIHTVQGYDLNYAGIIFGEEIDYDEESNSIVVDKSKYFDAKGKVSIENQEELKDYIIKIYKTLMFRGIRGAYIYVCNPSLKKYLERYI